MGLSTAFSVSVPSSLAWPLEDYGVYSSSCLCVQRVDFLQFLFSLSPLATKVVTAGSPASGSGADVVAERSAAGSASGLELGIDELESITLLLSLCRSEGLVLLAHLLLVGL